MTTLRLFELDISCTECITMQRNESATYKLCVALNATLFNSKYYLYLILPNSFPSSYANLYILKSSPPTTKVDMLGCKEAEYALAGTVKDFTFSKLQIIQVLKIASIRVTYFTLYCLEQ